MRWFLLSTIIVIVAFFTVISALTLVSLMLCYTDQIQCDVGEVTIATINLIALFCLIVFGIKHGVVDKLFEVKK